MSKDNVRKVIFRRGDENRIVIEEGNFRESLFQQQYLNAMQSFISVCQLQDRKLTKTQIVGTNIISFCGDRGEGKSSCMYTIRRILNKRDVFTFGDTELLSEQEKRYQKFAHEIDTYPTYALPVIDPSFFDEEHNILDLVISQLYQDAFRDEEGNDIEEAYEKSEELLQRFNRVKESMSTLMKNKREILDNIEDLDRLGESLQLQNKIRELFAEFLKYNTKTEENERKKLLICIDDLDLNVNGGYTMLEQIRKYLSNEYCVILIALKIEQMTKVVQNALYEDSGRNNKIISIEACRDMAEKYITKMFPAEHRVNMPTVDEIVNYRVELHEAYDEVAEQHKEWGTIKEAVVSLIFLKTRYLFYNTEHEVNRIIPRNLRSLRQLLAMLLKMDDFKKGSRISRENQWAFKKYFYYEWTNILPEEQQALVNGIIRYSDVSTKNHYVLSSLITPDLIGEDTKLFEWFNSKVRAYNISVGDVLYVIQELQESGHAELGNLLFFLQSYYSICLYEYYDEMVGEVDYAEDSLALYDFSKFKWDGKKIVKNVVKENQHVEIYAHDERFRGISPLQQFVGGSYFTYEPGDLLPTDRAERPLRGKKSARDYRTLRAQEIFKHMRQYARENIEYQNTVDLENHSEKLLGLMNFQLCEFFALTTRMTQTMKEYVDEDYRYRSYPYYLSGYKSRNTILVFDIMAIFANIINLRFAYDRFNEVIWGIGKTNSQNSFYEIALKQKGSLLNRILAPYQEKVDEISYDVDVKSAYAMGRLASASIIRCVDVQKAMIAKIITSKESISKNTRSSGSDSIGRIIDFYTIIMDSTIKLYGGADAIEQDLYTINYSKLLGTITSFLKQTQVGNIRTFTKLFTLYPEQQGFSRVGDHNIPMKIGDMDTYFLQSIYEEIKDLEWAGYLTGEDIKNQLSDETRMSIPTEISKYITKRQNYRSADAFIDSIIGFINKHNVNQEK